MHTHTAHVVGKTKHEIRLGTGQSCLFICEISEKINAADSSSLLEPLLESEELQDVEVDA